MCKNDGFSEKNPKNPSNFIFYPKVCYHLSLYSPGNLKKLGRVALYKVIEKMAIFGKNHDFGMRFRRGYIESNNFRMGHDYEIEEKMWRTLHFTLYMMCDKVYNHISNSIPGSMSQK